MALLLAFAALAIGAAPAPASSPPGSPDFDIQCMLVANQVIGKVDAATKAKVGPLATYYFGRVDSRLSGNALQGRVAQVAKGLVGQQLGPMLKSCGDFMSSRAVIMQRAGQAANARSSGGSRK